MCESFVRSRGVYFHTHLELSRSRLMSSTWWSLQLLFQELKEKTQVGELVVAVDQRKKLFIDSELSHDRGSKFSTQGSNRMLVI